MRVVRGPFFCLQFIVLVIPGRIKNSLQSCMPRVLMLAKEKGFEILGYTKLFNEIIMSTVWREPDHVRLLWITMLAVKDRWHVVNASVPGLADAARITLDQCEDALKVLSAPDPYSRSSEHEGRRIMPTDVGWVILNGEKYRNKMSIDERREYNRLKQREYRAQKKESNSCVQSSTECLHTDTDTEADTESDTRKTRKKTYTAEFDAFWQNYPSNRRGHKGRAFDRWKKIESDLYPTLTDYVRLRAKDDPDWRRENYRYVPHAERFLAGERWEDDWQPAKQWSERTQANIDRLMRMELS